MPKRGGRSDSADRRRTRADIRAASVRAGYADVHARADFHARRLARPGDCGDARRDAGVRALPADSHIDARADGDIRAGYANPSADIRARRCADGDIRAGYANSCAGDIGSDARASARRRADCDIHIRARRRACGHAHARARASDGDAGSPNIHADARAGSDRDAHPADFHAGSAAHCDASTARRECQSGQRGGRASAGFHVRLRGRRVAHNREPVG